MRDGDADDEEGAEGARRVRWFRKVILGDMLLQAPAHASGETRCCIGLKALSVIHEM